MPLLKSLQNDGHKIFCVALKDEYSDKLLKEGFQFRAIGLNNNTTNPIEDLGTIFEYYKIYKAIKPDVICHNAIKPNIYGTIAAGLLKIPVINNISGLGTLFIKKSFSTTIAKWLYKYSQKRATKIFFQNSDDFHLFLESKLVSEHKCSVIPGSGVDTNIFDASKYTKIVDNKFRFLFVGRLINDKGIREYIYAIKLLQKKYKDIEFQLLGPLYEKNSSAISNETLQEWIQEKLITYLGNTDQVASLMVNADCIVLPSYREGLSKVLIEASSMSLPIVTSDVPGCRDVVVHQVTGFLCSSRSGDDLAAKMEDMYKLNSSKREIMGRNGRNRAIALFGQDIIIKHYKNVIYAI